MGEPAWPPLNPPLPLCVVSSLSPSVFTASVVCVAGRAAWEPDASVSTASRSGSSSDPFSSSLTANSSICWRRHSVWSWSPTSALTFFHSEFTFLLCLSSRTMFRARWVRKFRIYVQLNQQWWSQGQASRPRTQPSRPRPRPRTSKLSLRILKDEDLTSTTPTLLTGAIPLHPLGDFQNTFSPFLPRKNFQRHRRATHSATDGNVNICTEILTTF